MASSGRTNYSDYYETDALPTHYKTGGLIPSFAEGGEAGAPPTARSMAPAPAPPDSILGVNYQGVPTAWVSNREARHDRALSCRRATKRSRSL